MSHDEIEMVPLSKFDTLILEIQEKVHLDFIAYRDAIAKGLQDGGKGMTSYDLGIILRGGS